MRARRLLGRLVAAGVRLTEPGGASVRSKVIPGRQSGTRVVAQIPYGGMTFVRLHSLQHSLWRSLEVNAMLAAREHLQPPLLDMGCGNGQFFSLIWPHAEAGIDLDARALRAGAKDVYACVAVADGAAGLPFRDSHFASVFANSVIEHIAPLDALLDEIDRVLRPGGAFVFTVPSDRLMAYLAGDYGEADARHMNGQMNHVHLLSAAAWADRLRRHGLEPVTWRYYFAPEAVFWWRMLSTRFFLRAERAMAALWWRLLSGPVMRLARGSVQPMPEGAGLLMVAQKTPARQGA